jgi:hypothetical protein
VDDSGGGGGGHDDDDGGGSGTKKWLSAGGGWSQGLKGDFTRESQKGKFPSLVRGRVTNCDKRVAFCLGSYNHLGLKVYFERDFNSFTIFSPHFLNHSLCNIFKNGKFNI